jgi:hypothetical protein
MVAVLVPVALLLAASAAAQAPPPGELSIPAELAGWRGWVLHGEEFHRCPFRGNTSGATASEHICTWPGRLELTVGEEGARFTESWVSETPGWISLPGDAEHWPEAVTLNGASAAVVNRAGVPSLRVGAGTAAIAGRFTWSRRPETLKVPDSIGLLALDVGGHVVEPIERAEGAVWLGRQRSAGVAQHMTLQVYRRLSDGIPVMLETRLELEVAGAAREETLPAVLPAGFVPMAIDSELPARLDPEGRLHVQVRTGTYTLSIAARAAHALDAITAPAAGTPWPRQEIWSYEADARLRVAALEAADSIDPAQANVPPEWREDPSYRVPAGHTVRLVERARGASTLEGNHLRLARALYLDFSHGGYTVVDDIAGTMRTGWRLDMQSPYRLMHASSGAEPLLITEASGARTGIEVRDPNLSLRTVARIESTRGPMAATGWQERFDQVQGTLHLPPGHRLIAAWGADRAPQAWLERWRLIDVFVLLLSSVVALRAFGPGYALIALAAIGLMHQDEHAITWLVLGGLVLAALAHAVPEGWARSALGATRTALLVLLLIVAVPFGLSQLRLALYPQLAPLPGAQGPLAPAPRIADDRQDALERKLASAPLSANAPAPAAKLEQEGEVQNPYGLSEVVVTGARRSAAAVAGAAGEMVGEERYAPGTVLQAGPGVPQWNYLAYEFSWSGPVESSQGVRFWIVRPLMLGVWRVLGVALLALLIARLARAGSDAGRSLLAAVRPAASISLLFVGVILVGSTPSHAQSTPSPQLLEQLKARLTAPAPCAPSCADTMRAEVTTTPARLEVDLSVAALATVAIPLPTIGSFEPDALSVDGKAVQGVYRDEQSQRWIALEAGAHRVHMGGPAPLVDTVELVFPWTPRALRVGGEGWDASGVHDGTLLGNTLVLTRRRAAGTAGDAKLAPATFAPFVRVRRAVHLGLDWTVETTVERLAPERGGFTMPLTLLPGERVLTAGVTVPGEGQVLASFDSQAREFHWSSALAQGSRLKLTAPTDEPASELWSFSVSPLWHVQFTGPPAVLPDDPRPQRWTFEYAPRPGETLSLEVSRPPAAAGDTLAIDRVTLNEQIGRRASDATLVLGYRSTQGGRHAIALPESARVTGVSVDGRSVPIRLEKNELPLALVPGAHTVQIRLESGVGARLLTRAPAIDLKAPSANIDVGLLLPESRWVLLAGGPGVGPVILYWGELAVFVAIALLLRRLRGPLPLRDWLLLGLGLSTFSWSVLLLFTLWMFALRWRETTHLEQLDARRFRLLQVSLFALSVVAVGALVAAIPHGLLANPDMRIANAGDAGLHWFNDRATLLPRPWVLSLSLWWYKAAMLLWALWLAFALSRWVPGAWRSLGVGGHWRRARPGPAPAPGPGPGAGAGPATGVEPGAPVEAAPGAAG